jgi:hypothetical protein
MTSLIPQQYKADWNIWKTLDYMFAPCNMFLIKSDYFNSYCSELFSYIFRLESLIDINNRDNYQKRALAFLSERFTSFWFWRNRYNLKTKMVNGVFNKTWKPDLTVDIRGTYN